VEVQPQLVRARVPHDVRGRDMADGVVGLPTVGDDRVVGVFGERPFQGVSVGQADAAGRVVRPVVQVVAAEWGAQLVVDAPDAGEDDLAGRVVLELGRREQGADVGVVGESAGCGGRERGGESTDSDGGAGGGAGAQEQAAVETRLGHGRLQGEVTVRGRWPR
jgi:hypothetical protein